MAKTANKDKTESKKKASGDLKKEIIKELKNNLVELISAFMILVIVLLIFSFKSNYFIGIMGSCLIILIALERRGLLFDKLVSLGVLFFLTICFFFL